MATCNPIITEDGNLILTEDGLSYLVTEDSNCPDGSAGGISLLKLGFPNDPLTGCISIGSMTSLGG